MSWILNTNQTLRVRIELSQNKSLIKLRSGWSSYLSARSAISQEKSPIDADADWKELIIGILT